MLSGPSGVTLSATFSCRSAVDVAILGARNVAFPGTCSQAVGTELRGSSRGDDDPINSPRKWKNGNSFFPSTEEETAP